MAQLKKILIDSDVLLDVLTNREAHSEHSSKVLSLCEQGQVVGCITPIALANIHYIIQKLEGQTSATFKALQLLEFLDVILLPKGALVQALLSTMNDKEDAMQAYGALHDSRISAIITRNTSDYKNSPLPTFNPEDYLIQKLWK